MKNRSRIILPNEMRIKQVSPQQTEVQIPIFPIPVKSNDSFLMYALCLHAVETEVYTDMPEILPYLQSMKAGLERAYQKLGIPMFEYRKFVKIKDHESLSESQEQGEEENVEMGTKEEG